MKRARMEAGMRCRYMGQVQAALEETETYGRVRWYSFVASDGGRRAAGRRYSCPRIEQDE